MKYFCISHQGLPMARSKNCTLYMTQPVNHDGCWQLGVHTSHIWWPLPAHKQKHRLNDRNEEASCFQYALQGGLQWQVHAAQHSAVDQQQQQITQ
jgi:hypothetical protein